MDIRIIKVSYDCGYKERRQGLGPDRFLSLGIDQILESDGHQVDLARIESQSEFTIEIMTAFELNRLAADYEQQRLNYIAAKQDVLNEISRIEQRIARFGDGPVWQAQIAAAHEQIERLTEETRFFKTLLDLNGDLELMSSDLFLQPFDQCPAAAIGRRPMHNR